ncbi:putative nucleotidyltransferase with HDIG domain [Bradyrhizobium macuxiense]|uniref:Putative nucleotidyltransferase with HDIG domain n=1 Tax=Bradyrhizobium macuxiense TaxID=1755647 RepID=A0A560KWW2_9BRAD|nr:HD domain-containing phosphohydrolase [Bradyrhizobium macuxiense]TWB87726.1 putative nucleotidyltransferase with HDIG domain [Bradyrhizobium macuxiense]
MSVHVVADSPAKLRAISGMLMHEYDVTAEMLGVGAAFSAAMEAVVVSVDLRVLENIATLKARLASLLSAPKRVFVVEQSTRLARAQAYALGATQVLVSPVQPAQLLEKLANKCALPTGATEIPSFGEEVAAEGAACFSAMFQAVMRGSPIDVAKTRRAGNKITDYISEHGLTDWLAIVRLHHEGTYQHCLLVTGVAVDFGLSLGMARRDIDRLHSAAMFHDIGKATIPLAVLDKPGKLDDRERSLIETHPMAGYRMLLGTADIPKEILHAVKHHHEYLDGSGYPDGLSAENISDIVRILTISDIFAALIEQRPYRPTMSRDAAYEILFDMKGKLESPLVDAFRRVAFSR